MMNAREAAFLSLYKITFDGKYSNLETDATIRQEGFEKNDKSFYVRLVYGTIEKQVKIDFYLSSFSKTPLKKLENKVLVLLRMGVYQLLFMDAVPDSAACNESVKLAKKYTHKGTEGFVNGILRAIARSKDSLPIPNEKNRLSVEYSFPQEIVSVLVRDYGKEKAEECLKAMSFQPSVSLHVNTLKTSKDELIKMLNGLAVDDCPSALKIEDGFNSSLYESIENGLCFIQDVASQKCATAVDAKEGMTVVDTCSCPGGKSFAMAIAMNNSGKIYSLDLHNSKLSLIKSGAEKLGISIIEAKQCDGEKGLEELFGKADRVLCDVPCSGLGVMSKKPELRFKNIDDIEKLPAVQLSILKTGVRYLKPNGKIVYSTCTLNKKENGEVVRQFLSENPEFILENENTIFPSEISDGFYFAVMARK